MFEVMLSTGKSIKIDADGFKTTDSGQLVLYIFTEGDRNKTIAVFEKNAWLYFVDSEHAK